MHNQSRLFAQRQPGSRQINDCFARSCYQIGAADRLLFNPILSVAALLCAEPVKLVYEYSGCVQPRHQLWPSRHVANKKTVGSTFGGFNNIDRVIAIYAPDLTHCRPCEARPNSIQSPEDRYGIPFRSRRYAMNLNSIAILNALSVNRPRNNRDTMAGAGECMRHLIGVRADPSPTRFRGILLRDVTDVQRFHGVCGKLLIT